MDTKKKKDERMKFDIPDIVLTVFFLWAFAIFFIFIIGDTKTSGSFGDSFGILTAIFSGLGFVALVYTLSLQREEFTETREVFKNQAEISKLTALSNKYLEETLERKDTVSKMVKNLNNFISKNVHLKAIIELEDRILEEVGHQSNAHAKHIYYSDILENDFLDNHNRPREKTKKIIESISSELKSKTKIINDIEKHRSGR